MEGREGVRDVEGEGCCIVWCFFSSCKIERTLRFANEALIALPHYDFALRGRYDKFSYTF